MRFVNERKNRIIEGELRIKELLEHLNKFNCSKNIWLAEDASGIIQKIEYDVHTNQLIGLLLPVNSKTGQPIPFSFMANTANNIEMYVKSLLSTLVYIVTAQPLKQNVPPFILQIFGTNNKFNTQQVLQRWQYTIKELEK